MNVKERLSAVRARMKAEGFTALIVPTADSHASEYIADHFKTRQWLCGFTGSAGTLVVGLEEAALFTDGRYFIQAQRQLEGSGVTLMRMGVPGVPQAEEYAAQLASGGCVGVDFSVVSRSFVQGLSARLADYGACLRETGDWFDALWADRPALPREKAWALPLAYAGRSVKEKLGDIRERMREAKAKLHVCNVLDDIAWTLNVRGGDVLNTPVVMSYLVIGEEDAAWYVDPDKADAALRQALAADGVRVCAYDEVDAALAQIAPGTRVLADTSKLTARLCAAMENAELVECENPAFRMKAIKNETELQGLRSAHIKDGLAVTRLMYRLKTRVGRERMTEISVSDELLSLRQQQEGFISPSFDTICAYRENAAMMHYKATETSDAVIEPRDLLLIDSGGQYLEGTTDITRTFAMGEVPPEQKKHFTAVLCSMLNLANAQFLYGCSGISLDILARGPIWDLNLDYRCGTGHGVGHLLSVHEGPNSFRWYKSATRNEDTVLQEGMVTTDEPGIYIEGSHGIRTENELVCKKLVGNEYGQFMGFETITCAPIDLDAVIPEQMTARQRQWLDAYHAFVREKLTPLMEDEAERIWLEHATRSIEG